MRTLAAEENLLEKLGTEISPALRRIRWSRLKLHSSGTDVQKQEIKRSARRFFSVVMASRNDQYGEINHSTEVSLWCRLNRLVAWMTEHGKWAFAELTSTDVDSFMTGLANRQGVPISAGTAKGYYVLFDLLYAHRTAYPAPVESDLTGGRLPRSRKFSPAQPWKPIEDSTAICLIADALAWTASFGAIAKDWAARIWNVRTRQQGQSQNARLRTSAAELSLIADSAEFSLVEAALHMEHCRRARVVEVALATTQNAVLTQILFLVGMRISEVLALHTGCLVKRTLASGDPVWYIEGVAAKARCKRRAWVVPDVVRDGIELLMSIGDDVRKHFAFRYLFISRIGVLPHTDGALCRVNGNRGAAMLKSFASSPFRTEPWKPLSRLHPHQARKTFASMVVRRNKSALQPLAYHYGHVNYAFTDRNYVGVDFDLAELIRSQDRADLAACLTDILSSNNLGGKAAAMLAASSTNVRTGRVFRGKLALERMVEDLIERGVRLAPCDWGYCVYSQSHSACRGDDQGPNLVRRCPDVCATCSNFLTTEKHRPFWEARCKNDLAFLSRPGLCEQTVSIVHRRSEHSSRILSQLNDQTHRVWLDASSTS
jgi:integrase